MHDGPRPAPHAGRLSTREAVGFAPWGLPIDKDQPSHPDFMFLGSRSLYERAGFGWSSADRQRGSYTSRAPAEPLAGHPPCVPF